jgi:cytosine/adenosine deaminase-related metal-dependent hydrolase
MKRISLMRWTLTVLLAIAGMSFAADQLSSQWVAFVHVNVVPMDRDQVLRDQTVIIHGDRIQAMGPAASTLVPKGARVINAQSQFLLPGLADMHVHLYFPEELTLYVANGVTTVFNLNGRPAHLNWRKQTASGELLGPTIYSVGPTFEHPRTADEAVKEVDQQAAAGYDGIKVYNQVSKAEYPALTAEAHRKNMILIGHVAREPGFAATLAAGQSIAHAEEYLYTFFNDDPDPDHDLTHPLDAGRIPQAVALTKQAGVSVIATLVAYHNIVRQLTGLDEYLSNPDLKYLAPVMLMQLQPVENGYLQRTPKEAIPHMAGNLEFQKKLVLALHEGGVPVLAGTDSAGQGLGVPGFSLIEELENFQEIGFTPYAALKTATTDAAALLRQGDEFGMVAVGKRADLLLVNNNPLDDVHNLHGVVGVMARGRWISDAERKTLMGKLPEAYRETTERLVRQVKSDSREVDRYLAMNDPFGEEAFAVLSKLGRGNELKELLVGLKKSDPSSPLVGEGTINQMGYELLAQKKSDAAVEVFILNTELYPNSGNTYDSLAETYLGVGNKDLAKKFYQKALEVQPDYPNAKAARELLQTKLQ